MALSRLLTQFRGAFRVNLRRVSLLWDFAESGLSNLLLGSRSMELEIACRWYCALTNQNVCRSRSCARLRAQLLALLTVTVPSHGHFPSCGSCKCPWLGTVTVNKAN